MFGRNEIEHAVELQVRSYELLQWLASAVKRGFISFGDAHTYTSLPAATESWIEKHYLDIPPMARPQKEDLGKFCALFSTYLENSFELVRNPGRRLYSPDNHCFCPLCSWFVDIPNLKTKRPTAADKKRARKMMAAELARIAGEHAVTLSDDAMSFILDDQALGGKVALCAYGSDLLGRLQGNAVGPAVLILWRRFSWLKAGSPKKNFKLTAESIITAEVELRDHLLGVETPNHSLQARRP